MLIALLAACRASPEPPEVAETLAETKSVLALQAVGPDGVVVGEDHRPSFEAVAQRPLAPQGPPVAQGRTLRQVYRMGPLAKLPHLIERAWKPSGEPTWRPLPPVRVVPEKQLVAVDFAVDEQVDPGRVELWARAFLIPTMPRSHWTNEFAVVRDSVLIGSFGLDPVSKGIARSPVVFQIAATGGDGRRVLLEEVLDPAAEESFRWTDFRIALGQFVGQTVRLELASTVRAEPGDDPAQEVAFPAWSVPRVLVPAPPDQAQARNVILISLDTLRADHVGVYGQNLPMTPNLDRFAGEGALLENAYTTYPSTTASHMSMLTGLYPFVHGAYGPTHRVPATVPLLAERLRERGYLTAAVTEDAMLAAVIGFPRGFDVYREYKTPESHTDGHVEEGVDTALSWIAANQRGRFFLFLHTYQVHGPYSPPKGYDVFTTQPADLPPEYAAARRGYAGDVLYTDAQIGRLLDGLEELGEAGRTIVVITSDHGEELGEHGVIGHSWYMTDPVLRVPLLIRAPGVVPAGIRIGATASLADISPTILELLGDAAKSPVPPVFQGASLVPLFTDPEDERFRDRVVFSEKLDKNLLGIVAHQERRKWKIGGSPGEQPQYFDLRIDPGERTPGSGPSEVAEGRASIEGYRARNTETRAALGRPTTQSVQVDDATQHKLRALGYVE